MRKTVRINEEKYTNCELFKNEDGSTIVEFQPKGKLFLDCEGEKLSGRSMEGARYLNIVLRNLESYCVTFYLEFYRKDCIVQKIDTEGDTDIFFGTIPGVKTVISMPLSVLDSKITFLKRTPGKLKSMVLGNKIEVNEIDSVCLGVRDFHTSRRAEIFDIYLSDQEAEYTLPDMKLVDELGQWKAKQWPGKTRDADEMADYLRNELQKSQEDCDSDEFSIYGGWKRKRFEATGYFRTHQDGRRWWLVDPEGYAFISVGLDSVVPGEAGRVGGIEKLFDWFPSKEGIYRDAWFTGELFDESEYYNFAVSNLIRAFGEDWYESWRKITARRLKEWCINTAGNWSWLKFARDSKVPYVWPLSGFPTTNQKVFRDFPDVFSPEFEENARKFAEQLKEFEGDRYLIGYFLCNEPVWAFVHNLNIAEEVLESPADLVSREVLVKFLADRYHGEISAFNAAWRMELESFDQLKNVVKRAASLSESSKGDLEDFSRLMIERFNSIPGKAVKAVDPHHLNLGMRYAMVTSKDLLAGTEYFDVYSINCYKMDPSAAIREVGKMTGLPVIIGEYHFGALDRGLPSNGIRAVHTQEDRANAYRFYVENAVAEEACVGMHYFILNDQPALGRFDGENCQIGFVDVCHRPYEEFVKAATETNRKVYRVAAGETQKYGTPVIKVEST